MDAKQMNQFLLENFPELEEKYHEEVDWQEGDETVYNMLFTDGRNLE